MMMSKQPTIIELDMDELKDLLERAEAALDEKDYETIKAVVESYAYIAELVGGKNITIARLQKMLFGASTEKTAAVIGDGADSEALPPPDEDTVTDSPGEADSETPTEDAPAASVGGHGRNGADAYEGAEKVEVPHESLEPGDSCPDCGQGTVYDMRRPGVLVRITGQAPVQAKVYRLPNS